MSIQPIKKPIGRPKKRSMAGTAVCMNPGRPRKSDMLDVSYSTLNRRAHEIAQQFDIATIQLALNIAKRNECVPVPIDDESGTIIPHTLESAFALYLENDFSKTQWERLVQDSKKHNAPIYPSYYMLDKVRKPLKVMLNKTADRLVAAVGLEWTSEDLSDLVLLCGYGFDSSSGMKNPHQRFSDASNITLKSEQSIFASTFAVVGLLTGTNNTRMWINPTPQSIRFCRPLRLALEKETDETIMAEKNRLDEEVAELHSHSFVLPNQKRATVDFKLYFTMIDGKVLNSVLDNAATTRCPVCHLFMDNFNKECDWNSVIPTSHLKHGISNLHCEIKTLELLIKLSCRVAVGVKSWSIGKEMKESRDAAMKDIKKKLFEAFHVRVDEVQHGSGTSLNGNTARTCLRDPSELASVLKLNEELVKRLSYVVLAFKQKESLNLDVLEKYCTDTYKLFFTTYTFAKISPSVHKMLRHGVAIARQFPLSLAYFAEDAAESMHKCYKKNSTAHARQSSRENRLKDVFHRSVDMSDPLISNILLEKRCQSRNKELPLEFRTLFGIAANDPE